MELKVFWAVLTRRRWVVLLVTGAAVIASGLLAVIQPPGYKARTTLSFSAPVPAVPVTLPGLDQQNRLLYAEQVVDDFTKIVPARDFAEGVAARLPFPMEPRVIERSWSVKKQARHLLSIQASAATEDRAVALAKAAADEIRLNGKTYFQAINTPDLAIGVVESAVSEGLSGRLLDFLFIAARILAGLIVGIGLAFLLHYLDDRLYTPDDAEELGVRVIGAIPTLKGKQPSKQEAAATVLPVGTQALR